jgi:TRAP-type C4-dicarboxylate transport system permease small subunit
VEFIKEFLLRKNARTWVLFAGALVIVIACLMAYFGSKPAEANLSMFSKPSHTLMAELTVLIR